MIPGFIDESLDGICRSRNRKIRRGALYEIRQRGKPIINPENEDMLGYSKGQTVGWVKVVQARELYSVAQIIQGDPSEFQPGQLCSTTFAVPTGRAGPGRLGAVND